MFDRLFRLSKSKIFLFFIALSFFLFFHLVVFAGSSSVTGKIYKADGTTILENAEVMIHTSDWSVNQWTRTDNNGQFSFSNLGTGTYNLEFRPPWDSQGLVSPNRRTFTIATDGDSHYFDGTSEGVGCSGGTDCHAKIVFENANNTIAGTVLKADNTPVTNGRIEAFKEMGMGFMETSTDSNGFYTLKVGAGRWMVNPQPNYGNDPSQIDWTYNKAPTRISFDNNDVPGASSSAHFTVQVANCSVTGTVEGPNGIPINNIDQYVYVSVWSREGGGNGNNVQPDGSFNLKVPEGSYGLNINTWHSDYGSPQMVNFTVEDSNQDGSCDGYDAGTINLLTKNSTIAGRLIDTNNQPVQNFRVSAWQSNNSGWAEATTDSNGNYSLSVTAGTWVISIMSDPGMMSGGYQQGTTYIYDGNPVEVTVTDSQTSSGNNFTLKIADATINGRLVDSNGDTLTSVEMGYAFVENGSDNNGPGPMMYSSLGAPVQNGTFTLKVPAGTYNINVGTPPGAGYCTGTSQEVTVLSGGTASVQIAMTATNGTISGYLKKNSDNGQTITGVMADIFGHSGTVNFSMASVNPSDGSYSMSVCPGDWYIGYWIDPSLGYMSQPPSNNKIVVTANQTVTKNIIAKQADATISGAVTDPNGSALGNAWVSVDTRSNQSVGSFSRDEMFFNGSMTDYDGTYSINVPSGTTYYVEAHLPPGSGSYINPDRIAVTPTSGQTVSVNLQFKQADSTLTGTVTQNGSPKSAFVTGWSEDGGYSSTVANGAGSYSLSLTSGENWHIKAMYENGTSFARSDEVVISPLAGSNTQNLDLSNTGTMPDSVTVTFASTNQKTITLSNGTTINIPAGALATSGNVTVVVTPKSQLPNQSLANPINFGYAISALDSNGASISNNFNSNVTIVIPYTESDLTALGITEDDLLAGYWDTTTNSWRTASNISIDKDNNTVTISINHFTDFAIFSAGTTGSSSTSSTSSTSNSSSSSNSGGVRNPEIYAHQGGVINKEQSTIIIEEGTVPWNSYVGLTVYPKKNPYHIGNFWQVSDIYDLWLRSFFNDAKILKPEKPSIVALKYTKNQLGSLPEKSLKLAFSTNQGKTWKILPTSVLDKNNQTVAGLTKVGGYYMLVAGYGRYKVDYGTKKAHKVKNKKIEKKIIKKEKKKAEITQKMNNSQANKKSKERTTGKSLFQKIIDFVLRRK